MSKCRLWVYNAEIFCGLWTPIRTSDLTAEAKFKKGVFLGHPAVHQKTVSLTVNFTFFFEDFPYRKGAKKRIGDKHGRTENKFSAHVYSKASWIGTAIIFLQTLFNFFPYHKSLFNISDHEPLSEGFTLHAMRLHPKSWSETWVAHYFSHHIVDHLKFSS